MKILIQWSLKNPKDWQEINANDFVNLPKRHIPKSGEFGGHDNKLGWINL